MSYNRGIFIRRNTKPNIGSRQSGSQRARTHGLTKERANKPNTLRLQVCFIDFLDFESAVSFQSQRTSSWSGSAWSMIRKSGSRFSEEIMLKQKRLGAMPIQPKRIALHPPTPQRPCQRHGFS
jgi:hypothetical protein